MAQPTPRTRTFHLTMVALEWLGLILFAGLVSVIALHAAATLLASPWWLLSVPVLLVAGFVLADLITGFGHFFADNFCSPNTFLIGHALVFRFRQHHEDPLIICGLSFRELNGGLAGLSLPWLLASLALVWQGGVGATLVAVTLTSAAFFMASTNQIHRWAHEKAPPLVRWLQAKGLLLSPRHHAVHHKAPHDLHFCISNGWLNPLLDRMQVWHHLADLLVALRFPQAEESVMGHARRRVPTSVEHADMEGSAANGHGASLRHAS